MLKKYPANEKRDAKMQKRLQVTAALKLLLQVTLRLHHHLKQKQMEVSFHYGNNCNIKNISIEF